MPFWNSINVTESYEDCWEWKNQLGKKYPTTRYNGKLWTVSRLAWFLTYGNISGGLCVCHTCDNPRCCNPKHLFLGTIQDNVNDREKKGRNKMPNSKGEEHGHHKLSEGQVKNIRKLYEKTNHSYRSLADLFQVSFGEIRKIVKRQTWAWLE